MNQIKVRLLPYNPSAIHLTSTGWRYPDGTLKPHYVQKPVQPTQERGWLAKVLNR
jgi:hypothetical protein